MRTALIAALAFAIGLACGVFLLRDEKRAEPQPRDPVPATLDDFLERIEAPAVPEGEGRITGIVQDADGAPIPGVRIEAEPFWPDSDDERAEVSLEDAAVEAVRYEKWIRAARRRAESDAEGRFVLERIGDVRYLVRAYRDGLRFEGTNNWRAQPGDTVTFVGVAVVRLPISIPGSEPGDAVRIEFTKYEAESARTSSARRWLPERPWIDLDPGVYEFHARLERGDRAGESARVKIKLAPGRTPEPVELAIALRPTLIVAVNRPEGMEGNRVVLELQRVGARGEAIGDAVTDWGDPPFAMRELFAGSYRVRAHWAGFENEPVRAEATLGDGVATVTLELVEPDVSRNFVLRVESPDGKALEGVRFGQMFRAAGGGGRGSRWFEGARRRDGTWYLAPIEFGEEPGSYEIEVEHAEYGRIVRVLDPRSTETVVMRFAEPAYVDARIPNYAKSGCRCRLVLAPGSQEPGLWNSGEPTDAAPSDDGIQRLGPVQPGAYNLVLFLVSGESRNILDPRWGASAYLVHDALHLESGVRKATIGVPKLYTVRVRWEGEERPTLTLRPVSKESLILAASWIGAVGDDGVAEFHFVPGGRYEVHGTELTVPDQLEATARQLNSSR